MASSSVIRTGMLSSSKSLFKRPSPLPLPPMNPSPFLTPTFSFTASPSPSPGSILAKSPISPLGSHLGLPSGPRSPSSWRPSAPPSPSLLSPSFASAANHLYSPSRSSHFLALPSFYSTAHTRAASTTSIASRCNAFGTDTLTIPATFEDPRSPKPYKHRSFALSGGLASGMSFGSTNHISIPVPVPVPVPSPSLSLRSLSPPSPFFDPRSPKPYRSKGNTSATFATKGIHQTLEEVILHVPRLPLHTYAEELGRSLIMYPRAPYPSAPGTARVPSFTGSSGADAGGGDVTMEAEDRSGIEVVPGDTNVHPFVITFSEDSPSAETSSRGRQIATYSHPRHRSLDSSRAATVTAPIDPRPGGNVNFNTGDTAASSPSDSSLSRSISPESRLSSAFWNVMTFQSESSMANSALGMPSRLLG